MDKVAEIKRLYLNATPATIARDIDAAVALLKSMASDDERERAAVYMDGLSQMRSEWSGKSKAPHSAKPTSRPGKPARREQG